MQNQLQGADPIDRLPSAAMPSASAEEQPPSAPLPDLASAQSVCHDLRAGESGVGVYSGRASAASSLGCNSVNVGKESRLHLCNMHFDC